MTPDLDLIALVKEGKVAVVPVEATAAMVAAHRIARMNVEGGYGGPGPWEAALSASPTFTPALLALAEERDRLREALEEVVASGSVSVARRALTQVMTHE